MKINFLYLLGFVFLLACKKEEPTDPFFYQGFQLQLGDLLFQDSDCGPFCDAIEKVTFGINNAKFSHVGILGQTAEGTPVVYEAISAGSVATPLDTFFNRSFDETQKPKIVVGRLRDSKQALIAPALKEIEQLLGTPYDTVFAIENQAYYCSELIYYGFLNANNQRPVFQLQPMTYIDPDTEQTFDIWVDYFKNLEAPIPEGQPGLNPGGMSRSIFLKMVHRYGQPSGWEEQG